MRRALRAAGLRVIRRRAFQLLPLWAGKPRWLWPLLHPFWKKLFSTRVGGKMLDEWFRGLPGARSFAFRHLLVCQRADADIAAS